jgi:hypothetical protein
MFQTTTVAALVALAGVSCAMTGRAARREPQTVAAQLQLCKSVELRKESGVLEATTPIEAGDVFYASDWQVIAWVSLGQRQKAHKLRFVWYDPSGERYLDSGDVVANSSNRPHKHNQLWHTMRLWGEPAARRSGRWNVTVYMDGQPLASRDFTLRAR